MVKYSLPSFDFWLQWRKNGGGREGRKKKKKRKMEAAVVHVKTGEKEEKIKIKALLWLLK